MVREQLWDVPLIVETAQVFDTHHVALLVAAGASAVVPHLDGTICRSRRTRRHDQSPHRHLHRTAQSSRAHGRLHPRQLSQQLSLRNRRPLRRTLRRIFRRRRRLRRSKIARRPAQRLSAPAQRSLRQNQRRDARLRPLTVSAKVRSFTPTRPNLFAACTRTSKRPTPESIPPSKNSPTTAAASFSCATCWKPSRQLRFRSKTSSLPKPS